MDNRQDIIVYHMSDNPDGELNVFIKTYTTQQGHTPLHMHKYMQINYVNRGRARHVVNNTECEVVKGDIFVIPPDVTHKIEPYEDETAEIVEFEFTPTFINQNFDDISKADSFLDFAYIEPFLVDADAVRPRLNLIGPVRDEVEKILAEAEREYIERRSGFSLMVRSLLLKLLVILGREFESYVDSSRSKPLYERHRALIKSSLDFIEENYNREISIEEVAAEFSLSQSYFSFLFKSITSRTFTEHLNNLRVSKAQELLKTTDNLVLDICYEVGFNNVNHFNRIFKQITGVSPVVYRKNK
ncbi:MAG: AraC family transcriptional regulator [Clostridiales bacterium]|nr:AraC family transcriptional regulator [Clostridiales bacterium]